MDKKLICRVIDDLKFIKKYDKDKDITTMTFELPKWFVTNYDKTTIENALNLITSEVKAYFEELSDK